MSNLLLKHMFNKPIRSVWNAHFVCRQSTGNDLLSKIYVVVQGRKPGIYHSWKECELQVKNFKGMKFKKFSKKEDALLYLEKSINCIEILQPKKMKSVEQLKKILNQYREKWKNNNKDVEVTQCKSFEDSKAKIIHSSRFCTIYNSTENDEISGNSDLECTLVNESNSSSKTGVTSFHLESENEHEFEAYFDSKNFTNSENEKHEDFCTIYSGIFYNNENYKEIKDEFYLCKNMSAYLEENVTDDNNEIYEAFCTLGRVQQAEFETIHSSQFSKACKNFEKEEKKVFNYLDLSNALSNMRDDEVDNPVNSEAPSVCTSTFSLDEEFPPYLFDMGIKQEIEFEALSEENKSFGESSTESGERFVNGYLELYTDGACYNNGKENAYGAVGIYFGRGSKLNTSVFLEGKVTNNIAEIQAAYMGLQKAYENGFTKVKLYTDSFYVVKCINQWMTGWKKNNWKRLNGQPVLNQEELQNLDEAISKMDDVKLIFVRGHKGIEGNECADKLARDCVLAFRGDSNEDAN